MIEQRYGPLGVGDRATADDPRWGDMDDHAVVVRIPNHPQAAAAHPIWLKDAALDGPFASLPGPLRDNIGARRTYEVLHLGWRRS